MNISNTSAYHLNSTLNIQDFPTSELQFQGEEYDVDIAMQMQQKTMQPQQTAVQSQQDTTMQLNGNAVELQQTTVQLEQNIVVQSQQPTVKRQQSSAQPHRQNIDQVHQDAVQLEQKKHRVLLLADETGRNLRRILQKQLGPNYTVTSILKPYATIEQILAGSVSHCKDYIKLDYIIILGGRNDTNVIKFQSALYHCLKELENTNVLLGKINNALVLMKRN